MDDATPEVALRSRFTPQRVAVAVIAIVLCVFVALGNLSPIAALIGFAVVAVAVWIAAARARSAIEEQASPSEAVPVLAGPALDPLLAGLPDPVIVVDRDGRVAAFNSPARTLAPALRRGDPVSIALRIPDVVDAIRLVGTTGESRRVEFSERAPSERWWEAFVTPAGDDRNGGLVVLSFHDLTPLRRVEEMRADFVANASHELRTPLAALRGFIETLQGAAREDVPARERFLEIMRVQATRMSRLIDDLLSLSRVELNEHVRPQTVVDLSPIVSHVCDTLSPLARERSVELVVEGKNLALPVQGERDELIRLFENLVENALKYGASGKRVNVTLERDGSDAVVRVRDFGPGIALEHLPRLTERFYRVDAETSRAEGGTGLGLAIVKHILARHRGRLAIESEIGKGAEFAARIPLSTAASA